MFCCFHATDDLQDHIIICGFGRVGQIIAQRLSERLVPFVALDVRRAKSGWQYLPTVEMSLAMEMTPDCCTVICKGSPISRHIFPSLMQINYLPTPIDRVAMGRALGLSLYFGDVGSREAHDVDQGLNLEKAGATAVVPETLEPRLQLAGAILSQVKLPAQEIATTLDEFRYHHLAELTELCEASGCSLGYGFARLMRKSETRNPAVRLSR
ncbi:hypothetical protein GOBAR_AA05475 [Gossypium barbadense]|uniref:RCK N-terminal domain-containing protein n=1 Tax=Gossypium barbadense TaxID=3634 RepID=A0A2P5YHM7_GOSBA|nr:hypothetical protein GOBAR_AA05475 [Gossypium barbadense]